MPVLVGISATWQIQSLQICYSAPQPILRQRKPFLISEWLLAHRWSNWTVCIHPKRKWSKTYEEAREELSWHSIRSRHIFLTFCQIFKIVHSLDCINFDSYFYTSRPSRSDNQTFRCVPSRLNCFRFSFFINAVHHTGLTVPSHEDAPVSRKCACHFRHFVVVFFSPGTLAHERGAAGKLFIVSSCRGKSACQLTATLRWL